MFKKILPHLQYPYTVGVIFVVWAGSLALYVIDNSLPIVAMIVVNSVVTLFFTRHSMR